MSWNTLNYHDLPLFTLKWLWLPWMIIALNNLEYPWITFNCLELHWIITYYIDFLNLFWNILIYPELSQIKLELLCFAFYSIELSCIDLNYPQFLWISLNFLELLSINAVNCLELTCICWNCYVLPWNGLNWHFFSLELFWIGLNYPQITPNKINLP